MYNHNAKTPPNPPVEQCPHCGNMDAPALTGVSVRMPWGFYECRSKAACAERRAANMASPKPRRCARCGCDRWLYGGGSRGPRHIRCIDKDGCRLRSAQAQAQAKAKSQLPPGVRLEHIPPHPGPEFRKIKPVKTVKPIKRRNRPNPTIAPAPAPEPAMSAAQAAREARQ